MKTEHLDIVATALRYATELGITKYMAQGVAALNHHSCPCLIVPSQIWHAVRGFTVKLHNQVRIR